MGGMDRRQKSMVERIEDIKEWVERIEDIIECVERIEGNQE